MKKYLKKKGIKLGLIVLVIVLVVVLVGKAMNGTAGFVTDAVGSIQQPIQKAASSMADWLQGIYGYLYEYEQLRAENDNLRTQLAEAQAEARAGRNAVEDNLRYRELLGFLEPHSDFITEPAKITSWSASNWGSSFTISKGSRYEIEVGDCVITEYGAFVGQVTEVGDSWATVSTVIDVDTSIGALIGDDGLAAMVIGDFALMQQGQVKLSYLAEGAQMFLDDEVLTSGRGGAIPQGVKVGTVTKILSEAGGQTEYGVITPTVDFGSLVQIFVIKDFEVIE